MSDPFVDRLFAGIPEEIEKLRPIIAELKVFTARQFPPDANRSKITNDGDACGGSGS